MIIMIPANMMAPTAIAGGPSVSATRLMRHPLFLSLRSCRGPGNLHHVMRRMCGSGDPARVLALRSESTDDRPRRAASGR